MTDHRSISDMRFHLRAFGVPPSALGDHEVLTLFRLITGDDVVGFDVNAYDVVVRGEAEMLRHALGALKIVEQDPEARPAAVETLTWKIGGLALKISAEMGVPLTLLGAERWAGAQRAMERGKGS